MSHRKERVGVFYTENQGQPVEVIAWIRQIEHRSHSETKVFDGSIDYKTASGDDLNSSGAFIRNEHPKEFEYLYSTADGSKNY